MVVGRYVLVLAGLVSHDLQRTVGYHFVGVHVGRGAGTALNHIYGELVVMLAVENFEACLRDAVELLVRQKAEAVVGFGSGELGHRQSVDEQRIVVEVETADREILDASHRLNTVKRLDGNLHLAYKVALGTGLTGIIFHSSFMVLVIHQ